ncbi:MAG: hypothetical protein IIX13_09310 [Bacteroidales bacterium]|nr:hypothetical protein [Bacteroidales bacterium]
MDFFTLTDFMKIQWGEVCNDRPQLLEVAAVIDKWLHNGRTGDVLNISMPTRFGKSLLASSASVWMLLRDPAMRILRASYSAELAEMFSQQVRNQYEDFCAKIGLNSPTNGTRGRWWIGDGNQLSHAGVGIGGTITGFGFDVAIVDDTAKDMAEAMSRARQNQLTVFKESVLLGRLEGCRKILNVGTRWTVTDWFSLWPDAEEYVLPAMVDGRSVCEAWKTTEELNRERARVSDGVWQAQYMQRPTEQGYIRVFEDWPFERVQFRNQKFIEFFTVTDPSKGRGGDFFVTLLAGVTIAGEVVIIDSFIRKFAQVSEYYDYLRRVDEMLPSCTHYIESNGVGGDILHDGNRDIDIIGFTSRADKWARIFANADKIKAVKFCETCDNLNLILSELSNFPAGDHDDIPDCVNFAVKAAAGDL